MDIKKSIESGCPVCLCNDQPDCPVAITASTCGINCKYGYVNNSGCPACFCSPYDRCLCPTRLTDRLSCSDGNTYDRYTSVCKQDGDKCNWVEFKCPIAIEVKVDATLSVTEQLKLVADLKNSLSLPDSDVRLEVTIKPDGSKVYKLFVSADATIKTPEEVRDQTTIVLKASGKNGEAFLISDPAQNPSGFGSVVLVPVILGLFSMLF